MKTQEYVDQSYLNRTRRPNIINFGIVLAKSLVKGIPAQWEDYRKKIVGSLIAIREREPNNWPELYTVILKILNSLESENRVRAIAFNAIFPDFWDRLEASTQTALRKTASNTREDDLMDY